VSRVLALARRLVADVGAGLERYLAALVEALCPDDPAARPAADGVEPCR
jgi:hypothetical protein